MLEASARVGGKVLSLDLEPGLMEAGPNTLLADEALWQWLLELGLTPLTPAPGPQRRYVLLHGQYRALPANPPRCWPVPTSVGAPSGAC